MFDEHTLKHFWQFGGQVTPQVPAPKEVIGPAPTLADLAAKLRALDAAHPLPWVPGPAGAAGSDTAALRLDLADDFEEKLEATVATFNADAVTGVDTQWGRGNTTVDVWWHAFCLLFHGATVPGHGEPKPDCISANTFIDPDTGAAVRYPNPTMRPLSGPFYAVILGRGLQDTNGGPTIDGRARLAAAPGAAPVARLFGAGNAVAAPAGTGYWGAGSTLGPAVVLGHIAGTEAASNPPAF